MGSNERGKELLKIFEILVIYKRWLTNHLYQKYWAIHRVIMGTGS